MTKENKYRKIALAVITLFFISGCGASSKKATSVTKPTEVLKEKVTKANIPSFKGVDEKALAKGDMDRVLMMAMLNHSADTMKILSEHLGGRIGQMLSNQNRFKEALGKTLAMPLLKDYVDLNQPIVISMIEPKNQERPNLKKLLSFSLGLSDPSSFVFKMKANNPKLKMIPGGFTLSFNGQSVYVYVVGKRLFIGPTEDYLAHAYLGYQVVYKEMKDRAFYTAVHVKKIYQRYGPMIDMGLSLLEGLSKQKGKEELSEIVEILSWVKDVARFEMDIVHPNGDLKGRVLIKALPNKRFADYLKNTPHGELKIARFFPGKPVVAFVAILAGGGYEKDLVKLKTQLKALELSKKESREIARIVDLFIAINKLSVGNAGGGLFQIDDGRAFFSVNEVKDKKKAQNLNKKMVMSLQKATKIFLKLMSKYEKDAELKKAIKSLRLKVKYQKNKIDLASTGIKGLKADRVIAKIIWPKSKKYDDFIRAKEMVTKVFGKEIVVLGAFLPAKVYGSQNKKHHLMISTWAKDSKKAIETLIAQVQKNESMLSKQLASYTKHKDLVSYFALDVETIGDFVLPIIKMAGKDLSGLEDALAKTGKDALIENMSRHDGLNYEADLNFSASVVKCIGRVLELSLK